jgi:hypothetical protein
MRCSIRRSGVHWCAHNPPSTRQLNRRLYCRKQGRYMMDNDQIKPDQQQTVEPTQKKRKSPIALIALIAILVIGGVAGALYINWYNNGPCGVKAVEQSLELLQDQLETFDDAMQIASSTGRIALSGPIADLQELSRETEDLEVAECLIPARSWLVVGIDKYTTAFLKFAANESEDVVSAWFTGGTNALDSYKEEIDRIQICAPNCEEGTLPAEFR